MVVIIEKTSDGFSAYSDFESTIYTSALTINELKQNISDVISIQVDYLNEIGEIKRAESLKNEEIEYKFDLEQFFGHFSMLNKSKLAEYIGINTSLMRQYSSNLISASDERLKLIEDGVHRLADELKTVKFS